MLVHRHDEEIIDARAAWRGLLSRAGELTPSSGHDRITSLVIEIGELESAIADRLFPERDGLHPLSEALRGASLAAGRLLVTSWQSPGDISSELHGLDLLLKRVPQDSIPEHAVRRVSEGYAFDALHPETYSVAAAKFLASARPASVVCLGIRSIGTSLSGVVAATLSARGIPVRLFSVRPRGQPVHRAVRFDGFLENVLSVQAPIAHYVVVDEGPGVTGSSFTSVARSLTGLGIPADRIVFLPSRDTEGTAFQSDEARAEWARHRRYVAQPEEAGVGIDRVVGADPFEEWSRGGWRLHLLPDERRWPAVHPQHERVKRFLPTLQQIVRFAGLGAYGAQKEARAMLLAEHGFGPQPRGLEGGYLRLPFVPGEPCSRTCPDVHAFIARYAASLARNCPAGAVRDLDVLHHMIEINCREADSSIRVPSLDSFGRGIHDAQATVIDGRMLAHEFVRSPAGLVKTDALDHAFDRFLPGIQDVVWDLAAAEAEFKLEPAASARLLEDFARHAGDPGAPARMPFYRLAYAAFQLGCATLARQSLGDSPDGLRFAARRTEFLDRLRRLTAG
jgi:hypothetical protein